MNLSILGIGYFGLVSGVCLAEVVGMNVGLIKIEKLKTDTLPICKPSLEALVKLNVM